MIDPNECPQALELAIKLASLRFDLNIETASDAYSNDKNEYHYKVRDYVDTILWL